MCFILFFFSSLPLEALSIPFLQEYVSPYGCVTCVVQRLYRGGTSRIDLPSVRNEWPRSDGGNAFCLFILKTGEDSRRGVCGGKRGEN